MILLISGYDMKTTKGFANNFKEIDLAVSCGRENMPKSDIPCNPGKETDAVEEKANVVNGDVSGENVGLVKLTRDENGKVRIITNELIPLGGLRPG